MCRTTGRACRSGPGRRGFGDVPVRQQGTSDPYRQRAAAATIGSGDGSGHRSHGAAMAHLAEEAFLCGRVLSVVGRVHHDRRDRGVRCESRVAGMRDTGHHESQRAQDRHKAPQAPQQAPVRVSRFPSADHACTNDSEGIRVKSIRRRMLPAACHRERDGCCRSPRPSASTSTPTCFRCVWHEESSEHLRDFQERIRLHLDSLDERDPLLLLHRILGEGPGQRVG